MCAHEKRSAKVCVCVRSMYQIGKIYGFHFPLPCFFTIPARDSISSLKRKAQVNNTFLFLGTSPAKRKFCRH